MIFCFLVRRKMVDYFEGALAPSDEGKLRRHLDACASCRKVFSESGAVLRMAAPPVPVKPDADFWKDFDASLSRKLDDLAISRDARLRRPAIHVSLRPALAMLSLAVVVVALGVRVLPMTPFSRANDETKLVNEAVLLDEVSPGSDNSDSGLDDTLDDIVLSGDIDTTGT